MNQLNTDELLIEGIPSAFNELTPSRIINELLGKKKRFNYSTNFDQSWLNYLFHQISSKTIEKMVETTSTKLMSDLTHYALDLHYFPNKWFKRPIFQAQSIPYGADDRRVFHINIGNDPRKVKTNKKSTILSVIASDDVIVHLIFARRNDSRFKTKAMTFKVNDPQRFY